MQVQLRKRAIRTVLEEQARQKRHGGINHKLIAKKSMKQTNPLRHRALQIARFHERDSDLSSSICVLQAGRSESETECHPWVGTGTDCTAGELCKYRHCYKFRLHCRCFSMPLNSLFHYDNGDERQAKSQSPDVGVALYGTPSRSTFVFDEVHRDQTFLMTEKT